MVVVFTLEGKLCRDKTLGLFGGKNPYILTGCVFVKSLNVSGGNFTPVLLKKFDFDYS